MTNETDTTHILSQFNTGQQPPEQAAKASVSPPAPANQPTYEAVTLSKTSDAIFGFKVIYGNGLTTTHSYAYLIETMCSSPRFFDLVFTNHVLSLTGRNLHGLSNLFLERKVKAIRGFNPKRCMAPETHQPKIEGIKRLSLDEFKQENQEE